MKKITSTEQLEPIRDLLKSNGMLFCHSCRQGWHLKLERGGKIPNAHNICPHCNQVYKSIDHLSMEEINGIKRKKRREARYSRQRFANMVKFQIVTDAIMAEASKIGIIEKDDSKNASA